jgi:hypothetical protein
MQRKRKPSGRRAGRRGDLQRGEAREGVGQPRDEVLPEAQRDELGEQRNLVRQEPADETGKTK